MAWYSDGSVAVTANSSTVTGAGTAFSSNARVGDAFRGPDGRWYAVTNIASATVMSIAPAYQGSTAQAQAYALAPMQGYVKESADRLRRVVDDFGRILARIGSEGPTIRVDAVGTLAGRSAYDSQPAGFTYFASDTERLYVRLPSGWSAGAVIARGPAGPMGDVTPAAIQASQTAQEAASRAENSAASTAADAAATGADARLAETSASNAAASELQAAGSASAAAASRSAAATSESNAASSAASAADSKTAAASSQTKAANSATAAATSESNAANSATAAASSKSAAATSESNAAASAAAVAAIGAGWTPVLGTVADGERRVLRVIDWTGGQSNKPATGQYVGPAGFVSSIAAATDIRGAIGVRSVAGIAPDASGDVPLNAGNVGALAAGGTASDSSKLGGRAAADFEALYGRAGTAGALGFRNKIINGKMEVSQRGVNFPAANGYTVDRWMYGRDGTAVAEVSQHADVPNSKFQNSLRLTVSTAQPALGAGSFYALRQIVEGYNVRELREQTFILSFWVRSSKVGKYSIGFRNIGGSLSYVAEYAITAASTWEFKTVTVNGGLPASGTWNWTTGAGILIDWSIAVGSTYQAAPGAWVAANAVASPSQVNGVDAVGNIFAITGVQLESGEVATPFEHRPYGLELSLCQRYYEVVSLNRTIGITYTANGDTRAVVNYAVPKRAAPTATVSGFLHVIAAGESGSAVNVNIGTPSFTTQADVAFLGSVSAPSAAQVCGPVFTWGNANGASVKLDAEL